MNGHGHVCPVCEGIGSVRIKGKPGYIRIVCPRCYGSGELRPGR